MRVGRTWPGRPRREEWRRKRAASFSQQSVQFISKQTLNDFYREYDCA